MKPKKPAAKHKRLHTWDDTPDNRVHLDGLVKRAKQLRGHATLKLPKKRRDKFVRIAKWHEETVVEMLADFAAQKGAVA